MNEKEEAYRFERDNLLYKTRQAKGILNRIIPYRWGIHHDHKTQVRSVENVKSLIEDIERPVVLAIGAGGGSLYRAVWQDKEIFRLGVDINHDVLVNEGKEFFTAVEADACLLPFADNSFDVVLFDYVLHHLVGQDVMETSIQEGLRVLRPGGYMIAREPSSFSPSGLAMNIANKFKLMHLIAGASNYEFAISPRHLLKQFKRSGSVVTVRGLSFMWSRRLPIMVQDIITKLEPIIFNSERRQWLADFIIYVVRKDKQTGREENAPNN